MGWSVSHVSSSGYAIDLDSGALGPPHFSGKVINDVKLCIDDMIAADLCRLLGDRKGRWSGRGGRQLRRPRTLSRALRSTSKEKALRVYREPQAVR